MVAGVADVLQERHRLVLVSDGDVDPAVVVEIAEGRAAATVATLEIGPTTRGDVDELQLALG